MDILYSVEWHSVDWETFTWHHYEMEIPIKEKKKTDSCDVASIHMWISSMNVIKVANICSFWIIWVLWQKERCEKRVWIKKIIRWQIFKWSSILVIQIRCNAHFFYTLHNNNRNGSDQSTKWSLSVQYLHWKNFLSSYHSISILHQPIKTYFYL